MEEAIFISSASARVWADRAYHKPEVADTEVVNKVSRREMKGYRILIRWKDGSVSAMTEDYLGALS